MKLMAAIEMIYHQQDSSRGEKGKGKTKKEDGME